MIRQDYIKRLIEQLAHAVARALGKSDKSEAEQALQQLQQAYGELGVGRGFLHLDARSLRAILGTPERARAVAEVCRLEARLLERLGETARAAERRQYAAELCPEPGGASSGSS